MGGLPRQRAESDIRSVRDLAPDSSYEARRLVVDEEGPEEYFVLTKRLHNMIHGHGEASLTESDRNA